MSAARASHWLPIRYREFYDVPRIFAIELSGEILIFECSYNETTGEYDPEYMVYAVSRLPPESGSWADATKDGILRGQIPVLSVRFDATNRQYVDTTSLISVVE